MQKLYTVSPVRLKMILHKETNEENEFTFLGCSISFHKTIDIQYITKQKHLKQELTINKNITISK
jgi:hypothetical protein